jgi:2-alkyl-3-oxoalkanoate reductase
MKIIITGATGSLGAYLTRWFAAKGHEIIALGRIENPPPELLSCAQYIRADITSSLSFPEADVCIHTAAIADDKTRWIDLCRTNVIGTQKVAEAAKHCETFIHVSTSSVYASSDEPLSEEMSGEKPGKKLSDYGSSKLFAEEILQKTCTNDSCFILRPRGIYGAGDKVLLPRLLKLVRRNKMIRPGSMNVHLSMTHFSNFAMAVENCIQSQKKGFTTYNVADDKPYVLYDVVKKLLNTLYHSDLPDKKIPLWILKCMSAFKLGDATPLFINTVSKNFVLDISKIKREINYAPVVDLDSGLPEIADWVNRIGGTEVLKKADPGLAWEL